MISTGGGGGAVAGWGWVTSGTVLCYVLNCSCATGRH